MAHLLAFILAFWLILCIAFVSLRTGVNQLWVMNRDGSDLWQLTDRGDNLGPCFSPDGEWITFTSFRDWNNEIYVMHTDGSAQTRLTYDPRADWQPRWGP